MNRHTRQRRRASTRRRQRAGGATDDVLGFVLRTAVGLVVAWFAWRGRQGVTDGGISKDTTS